MKLMKSKDGKANYTYYEEDKVEIRFSDRSGFLVTVYKPGRCTYDKERALADPVITVGQSHTTNWELGNLKKIPEYIEEAIEILNTEGKNIIDPDFKITGKMVPYEKKETKTLSKIAVKEKAAIYKQDNGLLFLYLGKGFLFDKYENSSSETGYQVYGRGYHGRNYIYIIFGTKDENEVKKGISIKDGELHIKVPYSRADVYVTKKKAVEKIMDLEDYNQVFLDGGYYHEIIVEK